MAIGIDPLVDFACKKLLGSPEHPAITLHFLNAILQGTPQITDVEILNPIIEREFEEDKYAILDVRARDAFGNRFNIEIQRTLPTALRERLTYYAAAQLVEQLGAGDDYVALRPSIGICILDAVIFKRIDDLHLDFRLMNEKHRLMLTDHLQIHLLELPKYAPFEHNEVVSDPIEQWCYFFLRADELTAGEIVRNLRDAVFLEATEVLEMIARDPEQRSLYETRLKAERDARAKFEYAREEGHKEGHKEGEVVGEVRGKVKILRDLLHETFPTDTELQTYTLEQLAHVELSFQHRLRERG
jgi:predicted transposase/invertase (TIGR01784 family)